MGYKPDQNDHFNTKSHQAEEKGREEDESY